MDDERQVDKVKRVISHLYWFDTEKEVESGDFTPRQISVYDEVF